MAVASTRRALERQPVHTVYGGAHLFKADTARELGRHALRALGDYAPDSESLVQATGLKAELAPTVYERVREKLEREPVEDYRIDFEDGYGNRPDAEEDATARAAAGEVARGLAQSSLPAFIGIRIKPLSETLARRALRTLELFTDALVSGTTQLPETFVVTLAKVTDAGQVSALADALDRIEQRHGLDQGALGIELMVEAPQALIGADGRSPLAELVRAGRGRCVGAHFGVYDFTASLELTAAHQSMRHPMCDFARHFMQLALANTGVRLSDGATNVMPVGPHHPPRGGTLTARQLVENRDVVFRAWRLHYLDVRHSLGHAFYQGWDLHPAQLVTRYAAVYSFFLEGLEQAGARLRAFVERTGQAALVGDIMEDAATGQGLLNFFLRGLNCGAITEDEALQRTGLVVDELRLRSFASILAQRRGK